MNLIRAQIVKESTPHADYFANGQKRGDAGYVVSSHVLGEILRNAHRWLRGYESPESKSKEFGEVLDCLLLTPFQWPNRFCVQPETYLAKDGERKKWRNDMRIAEVAQWWAEHEGLQKIDADLNAQVHAAKASLEREERIIDAIKGSKVQVWLQAEYADKETGITIPVKGLLDIVPPADHPIYGQWLVDLKTTSSANPGRFARDVANYNYDMQAALYLDLWNAATGEKRTDFAHVIVENYPPYECRMPLLSHRFLERGRARYGYALQTYCKALKTGEWPGYDKPGTWPITEPEPWMLSLEQVFPNMPEIESDEEPEEDIPFGSN